MATVQSTSNDSVAQAYAALNGTKSTQTSSTTQEAQDRFLTLLVTQLKNQDPLNPLDNSQVTTQLAQINTVSGIDKLNTTMNSLLSVYNDSQAMQAAGMIGTQVVTPGSQFTLKDGAAVAGLNLASTADAVSVSIIDAAGNVLQTQDLGARKAGKVYFTWDGATAAGGAAANGTYSFKIDAKNGGKAVTADALEVGTVSAVTRTSSGFQLDLGALGTVDFSKVQQIL
jgi:flagellar basal-body rod modification protein FlgD